MLTTKEIAERLNTTREKVGWLRKYNLLPMTKIGKSYATTETALTEFETWALGKDLSNEAKIQRAAKQKGTWAVG